MTTSRDSQLLGCILAAAKELRTVNELEAVNIVLDHMEGVPGVITDANKLYDVRNKIQDMISNIK